MLASDLEGRRTALCFLSGNDAAAKADVATLIKVWIAANDLGKLAGSASSVAVDGPQSPQARLNSKSGGRQCDRRCFSSCNSPGAMSEANAYVITSDTPHTWMRSQANATSSRGASTFLLC